MPAMLEFFIFCILGKHNINKRKKIQLWLTCHKKATISS